MKYNKLFAGMLMAVAALSSCTEDYTDWASPITNPQEDALSAVQVDVAQMTTAANSESDDVITIAKINGSTAGECAVKDVTLDGDALPYTLEDSQIKVTKAQLDSVVKVHYYSQAGVERKFNIAVGSTVTAADGVAYRVVNNLPFSYTPAAMPAVDPNGYYLVGPRGWSAGDAIKMEAKGNGVFSVEVELTGDSWFAFFPASAIGSDIDWSQQIATGKNSDESKKGFLHKGESLKQGAGVYKMTIDMVNWTFLIASPYPECLWTPGNANGWNQEASCVIPGMRNGEDLTGEYKGFAVLEGGFKFTSQPNWDGKNYGWADADGGMTDDGSAGNLWQSDDRGTYYVRVSLPDMRYEAALITRVGVIGDFNGWGSDIALTTTDGINYTGEVDMTAGGYKFRMNDGWDINLGGDMDDLSFGGDNIQLPADGKYLINLCLNDGGKAKATVTLVK